MISYSGTLHIPPSVGYWNKLQNTVSTFLYVKDKKPGIKTSALQPDQEIKRAKVRMVLFVFGQRSVKDLKDIF